MIHPHPLPRHIPAFPALPVSISPIPNPFAPASYKIHMIFWESFEGGDVWGTSINKDLDFCVCVLSPVVDFCFNSMLEISLCEPGKRRP